MKKTPNNIPVLDTGFPDILTFCLHVAPALESRDTGFGELDLYTIKKVLFLNNGWRLTNSGCKLLSQHYTSYSSQHEQNAVLTGKILLNMDKCCAGPWAIYGKTVTVFDPTLHFELQMVTGNLNDFIDFKSPLKI